ncbi:FGGY-family carbohydrate kinase [Phycicoccus avicenniae]|uniref:FGGY-family carbohydrate kinase n=1 Tax=Phycicoccus avicenniae TaxID=2828860 RepID=UPI003D2E10AE
MPHVFVGLDVGTGSTKGVAVTADGTVLASATRPHRVSLPRPGWAEMDPERTWWPDVAAVSRELVAAVGAESVAGLCVSGMGPCLVLTDADGTPVRPAVLYGIDGRATRQIAALTGRLGAEAVRARCGKDLTTQAVGPKLLWVREEEPEHFARARRWWGLSSWVVGRLTGEYVLDHQSASQCDPLYDVSATGWAQDWVPEVAGHLDMPRLVWPHEVVGVVGAAASRETGIPEGTPVSAGTVDAWAEAFSVGVRDTDDVMLMYGSTMFLVRPLDRFAVRPGLWTTVGVRPDSLTLAAGTATSGSLVRWVHDLTGGAPVGSLEAEAAEVPAGAEGLLLLPYFAGERTPVQDPRASGVAVGLTLRHTRGHVLRAAYEGIAFGVRQILELFDAVPLSHPDAVPRLVAVGGGTRSALLTQVVSDVCGRAQVVPEETVGASYGSALLAAIGTGHVAPETDWARVGRVVEPDARARDHYDRLYPVFTELYADTVRHAHRLADLADVADREAQAR